MHQDAADGTVGHTSLGIPARVGLAEHSDRLGAIVLPGGPGPGAWGLGELPEQRPQPPEHASILENALVQLPVYPAVLLSHVLALRNPL